MDKLSYLMSNEESIELQAFKLDVSRLDNNNINARDKMLQEYSIDTEEQIYRKKDAFKTKALAAFLEILLEDKEIYHQKGFSVF